METSIWSQGLAWWVAWIGRATPPSFSVTSEGTFFGESNGINQKTWQEQTGLRTDFPEHLQVDQVEFCLDKKSTEVSPWQLTQTF